MMSKKRRAFSNPPPALPPAFHHVQSGRGGACRNALAGAGSAPASPGSLPMIRLGTRRSRA